MYEIIKAVLVLRNGDKIIKKDRIKTDNIEEERAKLNNQYACEHIWFTYEEIPVLTLPGKV